MELKEVELKKVNDVMFKRIGVDVPILSPAEGFSSDDLPVRALIVSNRFGYSFFAHSRGFSVAKTADLLEVAEKLRDSANAGQTAQERCIATATVPNIRFLALSCDELTVCVCAGSTVMFHDLSLLVHKLDTRPFQVCKVDPHDDTYAKDFIWSPSDSESYLLVTSKGKLLLGHVGSGLQSKVEHGVVAASWSADGQNIAYVTDNRHMSITTSKFGKTFDLELPTHISDEDVDCDLTVDAIRWVRPDSIVVGFVRVNSEGEEDGNPLFVVNSRNGNLAKEENNLLGLVFYQLFPSIGSFVIPSGSGPYMLMEYLKPWEMIVAASRKSIDDHIVLVGWLSEDGKEEAYSIELGNDRWIPRIELQGSGDDNAIIGLAIDRTSIQIRLPDPNDDSGEAKLPPCPVLICITLEGKLSFFSFARIDEKWQIPELVKPPSNVPDSKRSTAQISSQAGMEARLDSRVSAEQQSKRVVTQGEIQHKRREVDPSESLVTSSRNEPDLKDDTVSLFERFTSPSRSSSQEGPMQKVSSSGDRPVEGPKLGSALGSQDGKQLRIDPNPGLAISLRESKEKASNDVGSTYEGMFRPFEDGSRSMSLSMTTSGLTGLGFTDPARAVTQKALPFTKTGSYQDQVITLPSSAMPSSFQVAGASNKNKDKNQATRPLSPQQQRLSHLSTGGSVFPGNSTAPIKSFQGGSSISPTVAPSFTSKVNESGPMTTTSSPFTKASQAGAITSLKVLSNQRVADGSSLGSQSRVMQDQQPLGRATGLSDMEAAFVAELEKVRKMAGDVDEIMFYIEGRGRKDNNESYSAFTKQCLEELETGVHRLSEETKAYKKKLNQDKQIVDDVRDEIMRVDAWRIYARSLMEQKNDNRHQELWTQQRLHPELEMKRKRVLKADQDLKVKIADMEKHLHNLELKQWQQDSARRRPHQQVRSPGQFLSVQNLYNTVNAQMAVAEELSISLAQQMETLNISWSSPSQGSKKKTATAADSILKSVGVRAEVVKSIRAESSDQSPFPRQRLSYSPAMKSILMDRLTSPLAQAPEPFVATQETTRRRRDSMDATWVDRGAPKTTIKRLVHPKPTQGLPTGTSSLPSHRQGRANASEIPTRDTWSQPRPLRQAQSSRMSSTSASPAAGFEAAGVSAPLVGRTGSLMSGPQWALSPTDQYQIRTSSNVPCGDLTGGSSTQFGSSVPAITSNSKESPFKWANNASIGPKALSNTPAPSFPTGYGPKPCTAGTFELSSSGLLGDSTFVPATKQAAAGNFNGAGGGALSKSAMAQTKPQLSSAMDVRGDIIDKSGLSSSGAALGHKLGSVSPTGSQQDGAPRVEATGMRQRLSVSSSAGSGLLLTGSPPTPLLTGPAPVLLLTGPTPSVEASRNNSPSSQPVQSRRSEIEVVGKDLDRGNQPKASWKDPQGEFFPSFSKVEPVSAQNSALKTPQSTQVVFEPEQAKKIPEKRSEEVKTAVNPLTGLNLGMGNSGGRSFDSSSSRQDSVSSSAPLSSNFIQAAPATQPPVSKSLFIGEHTAPAETSSLIAKAGASSVSELKQTGNSPATSLSAPGTISVQTSSPSSPSNRLDSKTNLAEITSMSSGVPSLTKPGPASSSIFSLPSANVGQVSGNSSGSSMPQPFGTPNTSTSPQSRASSFTSSGISASNQSTGSPFMSSTSAASSQPAASPFTTSGSPFTSASTSTPPQSAASPFVPPTTSVQSQVAPTPFGASPSGSAFSTASTQNVISPSAFGQPSGWPSSAQQQQYMFPGSNAMSSTAAFSPSPLESNEEDMEEEASTALGSFGGFGGLGLGSSNTPAQAQKSNPFGGSLFGNTQIPTLSSPPGGQLFRPAAFSLPTAQASPQQAGTTAFGGGFSSGFSQGNLFSSSEAGKGFGSQSQPTPGGFGQPAQLGPGQQALGSALGAFGQARQVGFGTSFGGGIGATASGGFPTATMGGGFANAAAGGGFASAASGGGFASAATGGGFAGLGGGVGFGGSPGGGGFQSFGGNQGAPPGFGNSVPGSLFTQMRK